jgi:hypothetical protein
MTTELRVIAMNQSADLTRSFILNRGITANAYPTGNVFVYTKSGNYASQVTVQKTIRAINEYYAEACRATI